MSPYKPIHEYKPSQRGIVRVGMKPRKGTRLLRDGDITYEECPECGEAGLRVRKDRQKAFLWCPCGYEIPASDIG